MKIQQVAAGSLYRGLTFAARYPSLAVSLARLGRYGEPLDNNTELLIEGFPRSGNSFAVAAFRRAQRRPVRIAHHLHAPGHAIAAVRANLPVLIMLRDPDEAVPEFAVSKPNIPVGEILRGYVRFYEPLVEYRTRFVVASFEKALSNFASVIRRINERFATDFEEFEATEDAVRAAHQDVEEDYRRRQGSAPGILGTVRGAPENDRDRLVERARSEHLRPHLAAVRTKAKRLYDGLLAER